MKEENPITRSLEWLVECGWTKEEATHLISAIQDESAERLWEIAPKWIEHCGYCMKYTQGMLGVVAMGLIRVGRDGDGWTFALNDIGMNVGKQMEGK